MRKLLALLALACYSVMAMAQENGLNPIYQIQFNDLEYQVVKKKATVGTVLGVLAEAAAGKVSDTEHQGYVPVVNAKIKAALSNVRRMVSVEGQEAQFDVAFSGKITNLSTTAETSTRETKDDKGKVKKETMVRYDATVNVSLTMTWLSDGVTQTQDFSAIGYSSYSLGTEEKALNSAISNLGEKITKFYNTMFPISANIIERGSEKKDKQKEVYLNVGSLNEVKEDMHFRVYIIGNVAGRETRKEVGKLRVDEVLGDDICLCKVQSGGKDIKAALDEGKQVLAISKD